MNLQIIIILLVILVLFLMYKSVEGFGGLYQYHPNNLYSIYSHPAGYFSFWPNTSNNVPTNDELECEQYGDDYNSCYSNPKCTIWFKPDGSTYCTKKFIHENI
jgi:hypothetical protein